MATVSIPAKGVVLQRAARGDSRSGCDRNRLRALVARSRRSRRRCRRRPHRLCRRDRRHEGPGRLHHRRRHRRRPRNPGLDAMLANFSTEHTHDEDEVRFIIAGRGIFHIHPLEGDVVAIEVEAGDMIRVPRGTRHWFDLCSDRRIRAIRWFQDKSGWTPALHPQWYRLQLRAPLLRTRILRPSRAHQPLRLAANPIMPTLYLLDIEGTTSPVSFVYDVLFPYARQHMKDYIFAHSGDPALDADLRLLAHENAIDRAAGAPIIYLSQTLSQDPAEALQSSVAYLLWLMDKDRNPPLSNPSRERYGPRATNRAICTATSSPMSPPPSGAGTPPRESPSIPQAASKRRNISSASPARGPDAPHRRRTSTPTPARKSNPPAIAKSPPP